MNPQMLFELPPLPRPRLTKNSFSASVAAGLLGQMLSVLDEETKEEELLRDLQEALGRPPF